MPHPQLVCDGVGPMEGSSTPEAAFCFVCQLEGLALRLLALINSSRESCSEALLSGKPKVSTNTYTWSELWQVLAVSVPCNNALSHHPSSLLYSASQAPSNLDVSQQLLLPPPDVLQFLTLFCSQVTGDCKDRNVMKALLP